MSDKLLFDEQYKYQRLADSARSAQNSVDVLANVIKEFIELSRDQHPDMARYAEECLSRTPYLRKMPITPDLDGPYRFVVELPFSIPPMQDDMRERELKYLRSIVNAQSGYRSAYRFVMEPQI